MGYSMATPRCRRWRHVRVSGGRRRRRLRIGAAARLGCAALGTLRGVTGHCHTYSCSASTRPARAAIRAGRSAAAPASASTRASRSIGRSTSSIASGAISRTCRGSCSHLESVERVTDTLSRWRAMGPAGRDRRVDRRDHQRSAEPGDRLAIDRRVRRGQRRLGQFRRRGSDAERACACGCSTARRAARSAPRSRS